MKWVVVPLFVTLVYPSKTSAQDSTIASPPPDVVCADCAPSKSEKVNEVPTGVFQTVIRGMRVSCPLMPVCSNNDIRRNWAQRRVGADLMFQELKRLGIPEGTVTVTVLDTGFDSPGNRGNLESPGFKAFRAKEEVTETSMDYHGHGTAVAGIIGGKNGIGLAPGQNLVSRQVTEGPSIAVDSLFTEVQRACTAHPDILNLSATTGTVTFSRFLFFKSAEVTAGDELLGEVEWQTKRKSILDDLTKNGCLLVQNSGNHALRDQRSRHELDNAILRVEAISAFSQPEEATPFSSRGEIRAPGQNVFTLGLVGVQKPEGLNRCEGHTGQFETGTSFAAPIVAGIAAQVKAVLKTTNTFVELDPPKRIALVNRILAASVINNSVNGYRAVLIAERWIKSGANTLPAVPTVEALAKSLSDSAPAHCAKLPQNCSAVDSCADRRSCVRDARAYLLACPVGDPIKRASLLNDLITTAQKSDDLELMAEWINALHGIDPKQSIDRARKLYLYAESSLVRSSAGGLVRAIEFMKYQRELAGGMDQRGRRKIQEVVRKHLVSRSTESDSFQTKIDLASHYLRLGVIDSDFILNLTRDPELLKFDDATRLMILYFALERSEEELSVGARYSIVEKLIRAPLLSSQFVEEAVKLLNRDSAFIFAETQRLELYGALLASSHLSPDTLPILAEITRTDDNADDYEALLVKVLKSPRHNPDSLKKTIMTLLEVGRGRVFTTDKIDDYSSDSVSPGIWSRSGDYQILAKGADSSNSSIIAELTLRKLSGQLSQSGEKSAHAQYRRAAVKLLFESYEVGRGLEKFLESQGVTVEEKRKFAEDPKYRNQVQVVIAKGFAMARAPTPAAEAVLAHIFAAEDLTQETFREAAIAVVSAQRVKRIDEFLRIVAAHPWMTEELVTKLLRGVLERKALASDPALRSLAENGIITKEIVTEFHKFLSRPDDQQLVGQWIQKLYPNKKLTDVNR